MLRTIEHILRKHLDEAAEEYERTVEMTVTSPFEVLWLWPNYHERRVLAKELVEVIKGTDVSKLIHIPSQAEAEEFVRSIYPGRLPDWYDVPFHARTLRRWLHFCTADRGTDGLLRATALVKEIGEMPQ